MKFKQLAFVTLAAFGVAQGVQAQSVSGDTVKIGFITDMSGLYADLDGPGGAEAIKMAIADAGGSVLGKKIEFISADNQNKADVAASKAREWFDTQGVDMIVGGTNSAAMLAISKVAAEKKKLFIVVGSGSTRITNEDCAPASTLHYAYDTRALGYGTGSAVTKAGGKSWFFLTADYAFGQSLEKDTSEVVKANGGSVVGSVRHPLSASDFSSYLLQAQSSKAQILGLANAGGDTINAIKAANEFGVTGSMKLAGLLMFITDIHALGLKATQGMYLTDSWYWNQTPESRTWSRRYFDKMKKMPSSVQAADYSVASNYLKAVAAAKSDDTDAVMKQLKSAPINDFYVKNAVVRDDGKVVHDMFLFQVKTPAESKEPWDYLKEVAVVAGDKAYNSKAESRCAVWK